MQASRQRPVFLRLLICCLRACREIPCYNPGRHRVRTCKIKCWSVLAQTSGVCIWALLILLVFMTQTMSVLSELYNKSNVSSITRLRLHPETSGDFCHLYWQRCNFPGGHCRLPLSLEMDEFRSILGEGRRWKSSPYKLPLCWPLGSRFSMLSGCK